MGPTSIIWWTAGVRGMWAPAISAIRGLHTPQAMTTCSVSMRPWSVTTAVMAPVLVSRASTSMLAKVASAPLAWARSRKSVPACNESTTETLGV